MDHFSIDHCNGVIFDFDGTMCFLFHGYDLSGTVKQIITEVGALGADISGIHDPFDAFAMIQCQPIADDLKMQALAIADRLLAKAECEAVKTCNIVPGLQDFISGLKRMEIPFGVATNNGEACVRMFLQMHGMDDRVPVNGRIPHHPELLKPNPWSIVKTAEEMNADLAGLLFIGDTPRDWEAANNAGCDFIGIAPTERKRARFEAVSYAEPLLQDYSALVCRIDRR